MKKSIITAALVLCIGACAAFTACTGSTDNNATGGAGANGQTTSATPEQNTEKGTQSKNGPIGDIVDGAADGIGDIGNGIGQGIRDITGDMGNGSNGSFGGDMMGGSGSGMSSSQDRTNPRAGMGK